MTAGAAFDNASSLICLLIGGRVVKHSPDQRVYIAWGSCCHWLIPIDVNGNMYFGMISVAWPALVPVRGAWVFSPEFLDRFLWWGLAAAGHELPRATSSATWAH